MNRFDLVICDVCGVIQPDRDLADAYTRVTAQCIARCGRFVLYMDTPTAAEFHEWEVTATPEIKEQYEREIEEVI